MTTSTRLTFCIALALAAGCARPTSQVGVAPTTHPTTAPADPMRFDFAGRTTKTEVEIAMRDGVTLYTAIYSPKPSTRPAPIVLTRTPYADQYGPTYFPAFYGSISQLAGAGYIIVRQEVRGCGKSGGTWQEMRPMRDRSAATTQPATDESTDAYDTVDWLVKHVPNNNGRVGMIGVSYPGFFAASALVDAHPAIRCASPQAPVADYYMGDDAMHHGCFLLPHNFNFSAWFDRQGQPPIDVKTPDGYRFFLGLGPVINTDRLIFKGSARNWVEMLSHPNYDEFWKRQALAPRLVGVRMPVMTVGGWYDAEDFGGTLKTFGAIERQCPDVPSNAIVIGPWTHGTWAGGVGDRVADARFGSATADWYRREVELPFFDRYLKDEPTTRPTAAKATVFETGANVWRTFDAWPPREATPLAIRLAAEGKLDVNASTTRPTTQSSFDEYVSDPARPVPSTWRITRSMPGDWMGEDQRFAASRPDVISYRSEPLATSLTIAGPIDVSLLASTSGTDGDFVVKLIDIYPDDAPSEKDERPGFARGGYECLVRGEPMRARFRHSFERPEPMTPNEPTRIDWRMPDVLHTFAAGHRVAVRVQSSWFPMFDRNPQTFVPNVFLAEPKDFVRATQRVYHASTLTVGTLPTSRPTTDQATSVAVGTSALSESR